MSTLSLQSGTTTAIFVTNGAYLTSMKSDETDILFPAQKLGEKLRGGIPVCAPVFGSGESVGLKQHGFARDVEWEVVSQADDEATLSFEDKRNHELPEAYQGCVMTYTVKIRENSLVMNLIIENHGETAFIYSPGFHPYFPTSDATNVTIKTDTSYQFDSDKLAATQFLPPQTGTINVDLDTVKVTLASDSLQQYAVWSANPDSYICVEPTMAGNLDAQTVLTYLNAGERAEFEMTLSWEHNA
jgi:D-hexose-6-phosphate mutarotase